MGFLDFLSNKKKIETIRFSEIGEWLNRQVEGKRLDQKIARAKDNVRALVEQSNRSLDELEKAALMNDRISIREKQIMEGHRKAYVQKMRRFLEELDVPDDFSEIGHFTARLSEAIDALSKDTQKNYLVLKQFLEVELSRVVKNVKSIEEDLSRLQSEIDKEGIEQIKEAKIRLKQFHDDMAKKDSFESEKQKQEEELDVLRKKKEKLESRLMELKKSREYEDFKIFIEDKKKYEEMINELEQELITIFAELNRPLKKYSHNTHNEKLVDKYIADPAGALEEDESLVIHEVLKKMAQELDTLELKDKQLEKTKEMLDKLTTEYLHEKKNEFSRMKLMNNEAAGKINKSVVALNISENESWLKSLDSKITELEKQIERINREIDEINPDYLVQKVKEKVKEIAPNIKVENDF